MAKRRLQEAEKFDDIFDQMLKLRAQIAENARFENYRDYAFRRLGRFDYTPEDCTQFHDAVEKEVMPVVREVASGTAAAIEIGKIASVGFGRRSAESPAVNRLQASAKWFHAHRTFSINWTANSRMFSANAGSAAARSRQFKGKAPGGYQPTLAESRLPFIFMNAIGLQRDVETILHEAGHAFHALATRDEDFTRIATRRLNFAKSPRMSMELLGYEFLEEFYPPDENKVGSARRADRTPRRGVPPSDANRARRVRS